MKWIKCEDELPKMPKRMSDMKDYLVVIEYEPNSYIYGLMSWAGGWNCTLTASGKVCRTAEIKNVVAWCDFGRYKG